MRLIILKIPPNAMARLAARNRYRRYLASNKGGTREGAGRKKEEEGSPLGLGCGVR